MLQSYDQYAKKKSITKTVSAKLRKTVRRLLGINELYDLQRMVVELDNVAELMRLFGWKKAPIINDDAIHKFEVLHDLNERRIRDAEVIATIVQNINPSVCLDIGTADGRSAALMAVNAPGSDVYTINIPPEGIASGEGGKYVTYAMELDRIGSYYRAQNLTNITQIFENTATWKPNIGTIDFAFVDGSHDREFVYSDTVKILKHARPGSFILWHDFSLDWWNKLPWVYDVCQGVDLLREMRKISGYVLHVRNSWIGIYQVP